MKILFAILVLGFSISAFAEDSCPNFQGDYVSASCPVPGRAYQVVRILQSTCAAIGFQNLTLVADGSIANYSQVRWEPVGSGKLLDKEDKQFAFYKQKFYDQDSLYAYSYKLNKATSEVSTTRAELIDVLKDGDIYAAYDGMMGGAYGIWFNLKNCKPNP